MIFEVWKVIKNGNFLAFIICAPPQLAIFSVLCVCVFIHIA